MPPAHLLKGARHPLGRAELLLALAAAPHVLGHHDRAQVREEERVRLHEPGAPRDLVDLVHHVVLWKRREVFDEVSLLDLHEAAEPRVLVRLVPERADVHARHLRRAHDATHRPHERAVHAHEVLRRYAVGLVEHDAHLLLIVLEYLYDLLELVGGVELVCVEEQQDPIRVLHPPPDHLVEVVPAVPLLLAR